MTAPTRKENGRPLAEALGTPVVAGQGPSHHGDTLNIASAAAITQRCVEAFKLVRIFEEIFGGVPVKNMAGRFRNAEGAGVEDEDIDAGQCRRGCGYPAQINSECFGCASGRRLPR